MKCTFCGKEMIQEEYTKTQWYYKKKKYRTLGRTYCSNECAKNFVIQNLNNYMRSEAGHERMTKNNPMSRPEIRQKVSDSLKKINHKPKIRGGNGTGLTKAQEILLIELKKHYTNVIPEYPIKTGMKNGSGYPTCYKVDIVIPEKMIGIEVDGHSHLLLTRQEQDEKKTLFLENLGWKILRFRNEEVLEN